MVKVKGSAKSRRKTQARKRTPTMARKSLKKFSAKSRPSSSKKLRGLSSKKHPRVHMGIDGDQASTGNILRNVKVRHIGPEKMPKIKRELKDVPLKEWVQARGVQKIPGINDDSITKSSGSSILNRPRPRSATGPFPTIVLCGLGFAGISVARRLKAELGPKGKIIAIDSSDRFVFIPALMSMASGFLSFDEISVEYSRFCHLLGIEFIHDKIESIDSLGRKVKTATRLIPYDYCVVGLGSSSIPLPDGFDKKTLALRHAGDAKAIWSAVINACAHNAEKSHKRFDVKVGIIGGGATGVQLASWMKDGIVDHISKNYPGRGSAVISLFHGGPDLLPGLPKTARRQAHELLVRQGIQLHLNAKVAGTKDNVLYLPDRTQFSLDVIVFCGGWVQSPVIAKTGLSFDPRIGLKANDCLQSIDDPFVFVGGDSLCFVPDSANIPGWKRAQNAKRVAPAIAYNIVSHSRGEPLEPFKLEDTPTIIDLRPRSIYVSKGRSYTGRSFWYAAQMLRTLNMFSLRYPSVPLPY